MACGIGQITFLSANNSALWEATDYSEKMVLEAKRQKGFYHTLMGSMAQNTAQTAKEKHVWFVGDQKYKEDKW